MGNHKKPLSRSQDLVVQELNGELLIYDLRDHRAFSLNETSSMVWKACDGENSVEEIGSKLGNEDLVWLALDQLKNERLMDATPELSERFGTLSRREAIQKVGMASMIALPVIAGLAVPAAAQAQSCGTACNTPAQCPNQTCNRCSGTPQTAGICTA